MLVQLKGFSYICRHKTSSMENTEIERKYLLLNDTYRGLATEKHHIIQGFISRGGGRVVRVRLIDNKGFLTIKAPISDQQRLAHFEWEKEITPQDAQALLAYCLPSKIEKIRYIVPMGELKVEIDEFLGLNQGLVMAEVELPQEEYQFQKPDFLGEEVTKDKRYYNSYLSEHPYKEWEHCTHIKMEKLNPM